MLFTFMCATTAMPHVGSLFMQYYISKLESNNNYGPPSDPIEIHPLIVCVKLFFFM